MGRFSGVFRSITGPETKTYEAGGALGGLTRRFWPISEFLATASQRQLSHSPKPEQSVPTIHETAYPRLKNNPTPRELADIYTPTKESGRFRGVRLLSWLAAHQGENPNTSAGRCSPIAHRAPGFVSAAEDALHAGSSPSVVSSPSAC
jgi:hypothetical protein